jgi:DnaK suppressor protein
MPAKAKAKASTKPETAAKPAKAAADDAGKKSAGKASKPKAAASSKAKPAAPAKTKPAAKAKAKARAKSSGNFTNFEPYQPKRNEEYMNESQRKHFSQILLSWKAELMEEVDRTVSHMKDEAANFPDPADRATQEEEFSLELRTRDRERKLIKKIESTLELIEQDDYGYCNSCGIEIGIKRLEARPTANLCIDCKTLDEIREKQQRG